LIRSVGPVLTWKRFWSGRLGGGEGVEAAARDFAGGGERGSLSAGSFADALVELEVGAAAAAGVLGGFDEREGFQNSDAAWE
jgi:hypothetical protein